MTASGKTALRARDAADVAEIVRAHAGALEPTGGGSKRVIGRPVDGVKLDLAALSGILDYEPAELVLTARAATLLDDIEALLARSRQRLAFEPPRFARLLGIAQAPTIGGVIAANLAGPRRVAVGAPRDHFLGFSAVSGRGETFRAGGKVVKNVTGYDLPKLLAGSWGTLAVLTEVTLRVTPMPETERTLLLSAPTLARATEWLGGALGSAYEVSAAAHDPSSGTALRLEGFASSVDSRTTALLKWLGNPQVDVLEGDESRELWRATGGADVLAAWPVVWRISVPPSESIATVAALGADRWLLDWGGGLIWAAFEQTDAARVRGALRHGGHATLIKAPLDARRSVPVFQPPSGPLAAVVQRVKAAFDPDDKLNPGRLA